MRTCRCDTPVVVETTGSAFPKPPFHCSVHSVFSSALNLRVEGVPSLCSLVRSPGRAHPLAAVLSGAGDLLAWGLRPGDRGLFTGAFLAFPGSPAPRVLFPAASRVVPEAMPPIDFSAPGLGPRLESAVALLLELQGAAGTTLRYETLGAATTARAATTVGAATTVRAAISVRADGPEGAFQRRFSAGAAALAAWTEDPTPEDAVQVLGALVGLGEGLTPAGDDFLVGYLGALRCREAAGGGDQALFPLSAALGRRELLAATTEVSAAFLRCAALGRFSAALVDFARSCSGSAGMEGGGALRALASLGHSSGLDAASGFLFCATGRRRALQGRRQGRRHEHCEGRGRVSRE